MAVILRARGSWPASVAGASILEPEARFEPTLLHLDEDVESIVEAENMLAAYWGIAHYCDAWDALNPQVQVSGAALTTVLTPLCFPRQAMLGLGFCAIVSSVAGGQIRLQCADDATGVTVAFGAGVTYLDPAAGCVWNFAASRAETLTHIQVQLSGTAAPTTSDLLALMFFDRDLAAGQLP